MEWRERIGATLASNYSAASAGTEAVPASAAKTPTTGPSALIAPLVEETLIRGDVGVAHHVTNAGLVLIKSGQQCRARGTSSGRVVKLREAQTTARQAYRGSGSRFRRHTRPDQDHPRSSARITTTFGFVAPKTQPNTSSRLIAMTCRVAVGMLMVRRGDGYFAFAFAFLPAGSGVSLGSQFGLRTCSAAMIASMRFTTSRCCAARLLCSFGSLARS